MACKSKIKQGKHMVDEGWHFHSLTQEEQHVHREVAFDRPLPPQVANDPRKLKELHRRMSGAVDVDCDNVSVGGESTRTTRTNATSRTQAMFPLGIERMAFLPQTKTLCRQR